MTSQQTAPLNEPIDVDIAIIGGGIAGCWLLRLLTEKGYRAVLFEADKLGCDQTLASQGIIHGGSKYALQGALTRATSMISDMPKRWSEALAGTGSIDISETEILSAAQYLIPSASIDSKVLSFLGSKTMASHSLRCSKKDLSDDYQTLSRQKQFFKLNEMVINTQSLILAIFRQQQDCIFNFDLKPHLVSRQAEGFSININGQQLLSKKILLACGEGFEHLGLSSQKMQKRPLQMVMACGKNLPNVFAHFVGRSSL